MELNLALSIYFREKAIEKNNEVEWYIRKSQEYIKIMEDFF